MQELGLDDPDDLDDLDLLPEIDLSKGGYFITDQKSHSKNKL